jgi:hypothetical protein
MADLESGVECSQYLDTGDPNTVPGMAGSPTGANRSVLNLYQKKPYTCKTCCEIGAILSISRFSTRESSELT